MANLNSDEPIEIVSVKRGGVISSKEEITVEYRLKETDIEPDFIRITITGTEGNVVTEKEINPYDNDNKIKPLFLKDETEEGLYRIQFDFYTGEELFYTETRNFFISDQNIAINCINSYPPVLYPEGGGLFDADIIFESENCWLRWAMDGETITEGLVADGYQSIQIEAPEHEGVYELSLELFPFAPKNKNSFDFKSSIIKTVPVYVNKDQKEKQSEYGPSDAFFNLFHFRGSYNNSSNEKNSGIEELGSIYQPRLAVKNGFFGYNIADDSGFTVEKLFLPTKEGRLEASSLMLAVIPSTIDSSGQIFYTGYKDGSFSVKINLLDNGKMEAVVAFNGQEYSLKTKNKILTPEEYTSFGLSLYPTEKKLQISFYKNGLVDSEVEYFTPENKTPVWFSLSKEKKDAETVIFGKNCFEGLIDELGVYFKKSNDGKSTDPKDFKRSQFVKYGERLIYADSFNGELKSLNLNEKEIKMENGRLIIPPNRSVDFPKIFPGNEKVIFNIELINKDLIESNAVFFADDTDLSIISIDLVEVLTEEGDIEFSIVFDSDRVKVESDNKYKKLSRFNGDFSSVIYRIVNNSEVPLKLGSIVILRDPITEEVEIKDEDF